MLVWLIENTVAAAALGLVVAVICRLNRHRPALCHFLWLLVLVRLVTPPIPGLELPTTGLRDSAWRFAESTWDRVASDLFEIDGSHRSVSRRPNPPPTGRLGADATNAKLEPPVDPALASGGAEWRADERGLGLIFFEPAESGAVSMLTIAIWAIGALLVLCRESRRMIRVERLVRRSTVAPRELMRYVRRTGRKLGVRTPEVRLLPGLESPFVWSLARPVLVWPMSGGVAKETRCRQGLVAHELAHLRRRDHWTAWIETAALLIHWWNPVLWWVRRRLRFHAELACDAWAVEAYPTERRSYAEALIDAAESVSLRATVAPLPVLGALDSDRREFEERLAVIFRQAPASRRPALVSAVASVLVTALTLLSWTSAGGPADPGGDDSAGWSRIDPALAESIRTAIARTRALRNLDAGEFSVAARLGRERIAAAPDDGYAWDCVGRAELSLGNAAAAIEAFTREIALGHDVAEAEFLTAIAHASAGDVQPAVDAIRRAVDRGFRAPDRIRKESRLEPLRADAVADAALAEAISRASENASFSEEASVTTFGEDGIPPTPSEKDPKAYYAFATGLLRSGDADRALEALKRLVRLGWNTSEALVDIACAHAIRGEDAEALAYLHRAVDAGFTNSERLWSDESLGSLQGDPRLDRVVYRATDAATLARFRAVDWAQLRRRSEERLKAAPNDGRELHQYGCAMLQVGDRERAVEAFRRQYEAGHLKANAAYNVACCYALMRETASALAWLERAELEGKAPGGRPLMAATVAADPDLDSLRGEPRFRELLERL